MTLKGFRRPSWSRTFIEEPDEGRHYGNEHKKQAPYYALILCTLSLIGLALQLCLLRTIVGKIWVILPSAAWAFASIYTFLLRPRRFSLVVLIILFGLFVSQSVLLLKTWQNAFDLKLWLVVGTVVMSLIGVILLVNMPMREPSWSRFGISKPFSEPTDKLRSPEDSLTFWQWMTVSWVSPLLRIGKKRQLNEDDIWLLPYEFQHTQLHHAFCKLKGSVLRRILRANWVDLVILTCLELLELITNYCEPVLLQQLLKAMTYVNTNKRPALIFGLLILLARVVNAQSEVFSLWYGRRCYERSRGELMMMLYEKTLHRKVIATPPEEIKENSEEDAVLARVDTTQSTDESTPLLHRTSNSTEPWYIRVAKQSKALWNNFRIAFRGVDETKQEPAAMGKIMNLMRYDSYEIAQRFWDFQKLIEMPLGLLISLVLIWRLLGWPAFVGVGVVAVAQILNYLLALVDVRFEKVRRAATDMRLQQTSQYIEAIRYLRWYGWQDFWLKKVLESRQKELNIKIVTYIWDEFLTLNNLFASGIITVAAFWAYTTLAGRELSVDVAFPALSIFSMVQSNMEAIPELIRTLLNANVALKRIQKFMDEANKEDQFTEDVGESDTSISIRNASFAWPGLSESLLHNLNLSFGPGLTVVEGEVASGKTALLQAILGELDTQHGELLKPLRPIAYCSQTPWLQSMTIRDNILFNSPLETERYKQTLQVCALVPDLASFDQGDLSPIGENGIGLSGGQKARVALARAIYSRASILLLDDPLSALDQQTAEHIVAQCFRGDLVKGRTVILVTHRMDLCGPIADKIVKMIQGRAQGSSYQGSSSQCEANDYAETSNGTAKAGENGAVKEAEMKLLSNAMRDKFEEEEHREHGDIKSSVYWEYLKAGSLFWWLVVIVVSIGSRFVVIGLNWYLKEFTEAYDKPRSESLAINFWVRVNSMAEPGVPLLRHIFDKFPNPANNVRPWLLGLLFMTSLQALAITVAQGTLLTTRYIGGKNIFKMVIQKVTYTTFRYYDITPIGRLMNRLTADIGTVDGPIGGVFFSLLWNSITWIMSIAVIAPLTPLFLIVSLLVSAAFVTIFFHFLPTSQSLRRLETTTLSPLFSNFGALLTGLTTVRAFRAEDNFQRTLIKVVDTFQGMDHFYWSVQSWLSYRLEITSAISTFALTAIAIYTGFSAGLTAFVLVTSQRLVQATHGVCRVYGRLQVNFISVERLIELLHLDQEPSNPVAPPAWWPSFGGNIIFENVTVKYAPHLDPALSDVSFELKGGTNTAIVGRTGSGKSTLATALLATVPVTSGRILIDGVDLATVDRQALRSRVTFLAQEPVLFEGTLRHNLDPVKEHTDEQCEMVIARMAGRFNWTLSTPVESGGKNLSQGQRQLVGLARAILRRSSIIIMDEATASIDVETAWEIQRILREELKNSTVITIAHRTAAVLDADQAIVLANGKLSSFGPATQMEEQLADDSQA
ncbi:hypothetical protein H2198_004659 [Neophaeococcomyces mojaviensis]|uniref:Uncharacterized protein n=1 Tax=Neophaeococcomyces mojaviensis TaxID=3383035 RepID=A0ACC3A8B0_9EURO|nr:hypothetical protein H2198_004659 [Knufia sp. JES_112]